MWIEQEKLNIETAGAGSGPAMLFIHGAGGESGQWKEVMALLSADMRVAALDLSGHGASPRKGENHGIGTYTGDILAAVRALGGPVALCGHSMGGALAMTVCLEHPESVAALILANTGARLRVFPPLFDQLRADYPAAVKMMSRFAFAPGADPQLIPAYEERLSCVAPDTVIQDFTICNGFDIMPRLAGIQKRTLIICCEKDQLTPPKYSNFLRDGIAGSTLVQIPGRGHMSMLEAPAEFAEAVREFLSVHEIKTSPTA